MLNKLTDFYSGVGKTGFINNALEQQKSTGAPLSSSKVSLGGNLYRVQLVEITFDDADFASSRRVHLAKISERHPVSLSSWCILLV